MKLQKQTIYNDLTLPVGRYGRVTKVLSDWFGPDWIQVGDIVFQARSVCHVFATEIFNVTRGIAHYTNNTHWRQGVIAQKPFIEIEVLK